MTTVMAHLLGYGLWFYITVVALVVIYFTMLCYLKCKVSLDIGSGACIFPLKQGHQYRTQARRPTDMKLVLVPLIFLLLRMWSAIIDAYIYYYSHSKNPFGAGGTYVIVTIAVSSVDQKLIFYPEPCLYTSLLCCSYT